METIATLDKLIADHGLMTEIEPIVTSIESGPKLTQNHYGAYMSALSAMAQDDQMRQIVAYAMIRAGGNEQGIKSALRMF